MRCAPCSTATNALGNRSLQKAHVRPCIRVAIKVSLERAGPQWCSCMATCMRSCVLGAGGRWLQQRMEQCVSTPQRCHAGERWTGYAGITLQLLTYLGHRSLHFRRCDRCGWLHRQVVGVQTAVPEGTNTLSLTMSSCLDAMRTVRCTYWTPVP
jgi:hypothetical protein